MNSKNILKRFSIVLLIILFSNNFSYAKNNKDLINEILKNTKSETVEYGIRATFKTKLKGKDVCINLLKDLNFYENINENINEKFFCIKFNKKNVNGYIESLKYDNHNIVSLNISILSKKNELSNLKDYIKNVIEKKYNNVKYFQYLKAKTLRCDIKKINKDIISLLKQKGATNINTLNINSGYITTAYTKCYETIINNNFNKIDFNYAVCSYSSGNYIVIGTPEIITTY